LEAAQIIVDAVDAKKSEDILYHFSKSDNFAILGVPKKKGTKVYRR
jgi:hypothetical protein